MKQGLRLSAAFIAVTALGVPGLAHAGDREHQAVQKLIQAYGGDKLRNLKSVSITNDIREGWIGQGRTPEFVELGPLVRDQYFDLVNMRGSVEAAGGGGSFNNRVIVKDGAAVNINYGEGVYATSEDSSFHQNYGGDIRGNDLLLAFDIMKNPEKVTYKDKRNYKGVPHHLLEFDMDGTTIEPLIWMNSATGRISRMERQMPDYKFHYVFGNYKTERGLTYAGDFTLYIDDHVAQYTKSRILKANRVKPSIFKIDAGVTPEPEIVDNTDMNVDLVSAGVHQVGQGGRFSAFVDTGDHLIAIGMYAGLKERYEAYGAVKGEKPLKYVIATHHHEDHLSGAAEALELGAMLVAPEAAKPELRSKVSDAVDSKADFVEGKTHSVGPVQMHMVDTPHASDYAIVYIPGAKAVFEEDHYGGRFKDRASKVNGSGVALRNHVKALGLDVETLLSGHGRKQESWAAFSAAADAHIPGLCPTGRKICKDMK